MPMSATGDVERGFTLIEVLAVLALIGLLSALVFPEFLRRHDRIEMKMIETLIQNDLNHVREEAIVERCLGLISFEPNGYHFQIGETDIRRGFTHFKLIFKEEDTEADGFNEVDSEEYQPVDDNPQVRFNHEGICEAKKFQWETSYYTGELQVSEDGMAGWTYAPK